jgi:Tfp pilus assembly protein PilP
MAMKRSIGILAIAILTGAAWAQNPDAIENVRSTMKSLQQKQTSDSNAALAAAGVPAQTPAAKPAADPTAPAKPAAPAKKTAAQTAKPAGASAKPGAAATAQAKQAAPAKNTAAQTAKPATGASLKPAALTTAPTKQAAPAKSGAAASLTKTSAAPAKTAAHPRDPMTPRTAQVKTVNSHPVIVAKPATTKIAAKPVVPSEPKPSFPAANGPEPVATNSEAIKTADAAKAAKPEDKKWAMNGKRDPFFSPVVQQTSGSGCSTGKKCLEIGQINLRGVVHSDGGFIAVVTNNLNKAYFLRENDPVFNGYVVKITGDSVVFQETVQDKLGKPLIREVVKRLFTPAV